MRSGNQASIFYMNNSLRQEVKDGNGSRLSIYSHRRFDSRPSCDLAADGVFLTPWTDAATSHFLTFVLFVLPSVQARYASTSRVDRLVEASASSS